MIASSQTWNLSFSGFFWAEKVWLERGHICWRHGRNVDREQYGYLRPISLL